MPPRCAPSCWGHCTQARVACVSCNIKVMLARVCWLQHHRPSSISHENTSREAADVCSNRDTASRPAWPVLCQGGRGALDYGRICSETTAHT